MKNLVAFTALLFAACTLPPPAAAVGGVADIAIYDRAQNRTLPVYVHEGRYYVVGRPGNEYEIRMRNRLHGDILTVVSVDGVNVLTGDTADWDQGGYVLGGHQNIGIKGWRKSQERVAAFYFTALPDSYAARTGRPDHVGVIGVAVYRAKLEPSTGFSPSPSPRAKAEAPSSQSALDERSDAGPAADSVEGAGTRSRAGATEPAQQSTRLGTGHGRSEASPVTYTEFDRATTVPAEVITIYYDSYRNLVAQGVIHAPSIARPQPFPGHFVPDPR